MKENKPGIFYCSVIYNRNLTDQIYLMRLDCEEIARQALPGQFVNIKVNDDLFPLLRKPFSICRCNANEGWFEVIWKVVGKGTEIMAKYKPGQKVNVLGPLGKGFEVPEEIRLAILVAGGLGVAPLPFLSDQLTRFDIPTVVFLGARTATEISLVEVFTELGVEIHLSTDDGTMGTQGVVTEILEDYLKKQDLLENIHMFCCGPIPFLRRIIEISRQFKIESQISIETMMGCGFGICMGCPVQVRNLQTGEAQYKLTCIDGPVFRASEVILHG